MTGNFFRLLATGCAIFAFSATALLAQNVQLRSMDGEISVTGTLLSFDGTTYIVRTAIGDIDVEAAQVQCTGEGCPAPQSQAPIFSISGSKTIGLGLIPALAEAYSYARDTRLVQTVGERGVTTLSITDSTGNPVTDIELRTPGSTIGLEELLAGQADITISARELRNDENENFQRAGFGHLSEPGIENILALDGLLLVTSKSNPVRSISMENVSRVFAGQITNWSDLDGPDAPITIYAREFASGTIEAFNNRVMKPAKRVLSAEAIVVESDRAVSDAVADDPFGIGISSFANIRNANALAIRGACGLLSPPTEFAIKTEEYPLTRRLLYYTPSKNIGPQARDFTTFALSDEAQDIIVTQGFVDQSITAVPVNQMGLRFAASIVEGNNSVTLARLRELTTELIGAERLSVTIRFLPGGASFDNKARADIARLAQMIGDGRFRGQEIMLIGFSDSIGEVSRNRILSRARADQVRLALERAIPDGAPTDTEFSVFGFGEMSPLRCNESEEGRAVNRRVEIWVRPLPIRG